MKYFNKYTSNTLAGTSNQSYAILEEPEARYIGRVYYRVQVPGTYAYSFLFSNITDTTIAGGDFSHKNLVLDEWEMYAMHIGVCSSVDFENAPSPVLLPLTIDGKYAKTVAPGEFFATDPYTLTVNEGEYICLQMTFGGKAAPNHPEIQIPTFRKLDTDNGFVPSSDIPVPSMVGCSRKSDLRVAFLGDSITQGIGSTPNSYNHWCAVAANVAGDNYSYWNLGVGYARASDAATDSAWLFKAKQNDVVVVCLGTNDLLHDCGSCCIKKSLDTIVAALKKAGCKVILQTLPPFGYEGEKVDEWNKVNDYILNTLSEKVDGVFNNVALIGCKDALHNGAYGAHPNDEGCAIWGKAFGEYLSDFLKKAQN